MKLILVKKFPVLYFDQVFLNYTFEFDNDEFCLYNACVNLTEQNKHLLKKLDDIQSIIEHG